jgi:hypothetical protein
MWLGTEEEEGYRTGPPGYIGWRNSFLGIDSGAPYTFKNTGSVLLQEKLRAHNLSMGKEEALPSCHQSVWGGRGPLMLLWDVLISLLGKERTLSILLNPFDSEEV